MASKVEKTAANQSAMQAQAAAKAVMQRFTKLTKAMPDKREAEGRKEDFDEIYGRYSAVEAVEQSSRCSQCGVPFCQVHCPLHNNIPDWLKLTAEGRLQEAYEISQATNTFPEVCGRICPQDRLCEGNCVIEKGFESVSIGAVEKYITDSAWEQGWVTAPTARSERTQSVGIIGGGPAGLAAADALRRKGYQVHVYDRYDRMGGLMIYGIPGFKLEKDVVARRTALLAEGGIQMHSNFEVGRDAMLSELREKHDALLIATGVYKPRELDAPGDTLPGIVPALSYLIASNRIGLGDPVPEFDSGVLNAKDKKVVVIGGGDTAMDCVRTAVRQGAASVKLLYRRNRVNMPGSQREVQNAEEEGVDFVWLTAPESFHGAGHVRSVKASEMHLGLPDATGRQVPTKLEGSEFILEADLVIKALGFDPEDVPALFGAPELAVTRWGTLRVDHKTMMSNLEGVFAAGDIVRGASLVVWAIRDGRDAAESIHRYVQSKASGLAAAAE